MGGTISEGRGLSLVKGVLNNFGASVAPTINDDKNDGYSPSSHWTTLSNQVFLCTDNTVGAAVWVDLTNFGALTFRGVWNAATNTPVLASGVGSEGDFYIVSVSGSTNLDGITDWLAGDMAVFANSVWSKIDNTEVIYTFQTVYDASTSSPQIVLDAVNGPIETRDNATPLVGDLTRILNNAGSVKYIGVASDGVTTDRRFIPSSNVETLAADKVLAATAAQYQLLDGGALDRNVDLPTAVTNMVYSFANTGSSNNLIIRDASMVAIDDPLIPGESARYYYEGTNWIRISPRKFNNLEAQTAKIDNLSGFVQAIGGVLSAGPLPAFTPITDLLTVDVNGKTGFTLSQAVTDPNTLIVNLNAGQYLIPGVHFNVSGTSFTWLDPVISGSPALTLKIGDQIAVRYNTNSLLSTQKLIKIEADHDAVYLGRPVLAIAQNGDGNFGFVIPDDFTTLIRAEIKCYPVGGAAAAGRNIDMFSSYGGIGDPANDKVESDIVSTYDFTGLADRLTSLDVSAILTNLAAGDEGGIFVDQNAVGGTINYTRLEIEYI